MESVSRETKFELIKQLQLQYHQNQADLLSKERLVSDRGYYHSVEETEISPVCRNTAREEAKTEKVLGIRFLIAGVLLLTFILVDKEGKVFAGFTTKEIAAAISFDYGMVLETWAENMSGS